MEPDWIEVGLPPGQISEKEYEADRARLDDVHNELAGRAAPTTLPRLDGVLAAWDTGDPITRRELLVSLFDALHVGEGRIEAYTTEA